MVVIAVAVLLFGGRGKISGLMGDFAKGIKAFKSGMKDEDEPVTMPPAQVAPPAGAASTATIADRPREHA
jgi:sec-independent protein translocase protein TatA